jgi:hypothetical protein
MSDARQFEELSQRLTRISALSAREADHLIDEVLAFLDESLEQFVRRRHRELQQAGYANAGIYQQLVTEAAARRFRAPDLSTRQIRRLVYG